MPGKKHLTRTDIRTFLRQNPVATDEEMARHFGVKAERIRAIRRKNGIPLAIGSTALNSAVSEPRTRVGETPDSRATDQIFPTAWQEFPTVFPQPPNPLNQEIMFHYRRLAPVMGIEYTRYGPVGLIPYFISEMKNLNGRIKAQDEEIARLSSTIQSLQGSELYRRVTQQEQTLRHAGNELGQTRGELVRLRKQHELLSQSHTHQSAHLSTLERELKFTKQQYTVLRQRNAELQSCISESRSELKDAQRRSREEGALDQDRRYRLLFTDQEISARVLRRQATDKQTDRMTRISKLAHATILEALESAKDATIAETQQKFMKLALRGQSDAPEKLLR